MKRLLNWFRLKELESDLDRELEYFHRDSRTRQTSLLASMLEACREYIAGAFIHKLRKRFTDVLGPAGSWRLAELRQDYRAIAVMIFGEPPSFDRLLEGLVALENEINRS